MIRLFPGHGSTYLVPGWVNAGLKHAVVSTVEMPGAVRVSIPQHMRLRLSSLEGKKGKSSTRL